MLTSTLTYTYIYVANVSRYELSNVTEHYKSKREWMAAYKLSSQSDQMNIFLPNKPQFLLTDSCLEDTTGNRQRGASHDKKKTLINMSCGFTNINIKVMHVIRVSFPNCHSSL